MSRAAPDWKNSSERPSRWVAAAVRGSHMGHRSIEPLVWVIVAAVAACGTKSSNGLGSGDDEGDDGGGAGGAGQGADSGAGFGAPGDGGSFSSAGGGGDGGDSGAVIPLTVTLVDQCSTGTPAGLSAAAVKSLLAGGSAGSLRILYPYGGTIFPRGLIAPTVMWDGATADYVYVHLKSKAFEYKGCLAPTAAGQVEIPQNVWTAASAHASGASDPFALSLAVISSGTVTGPVTQSLVIAPATLSGSIYYNSYTSKLVSAGGGGAVLRIVPGQSAQLFLGASGCTGCHAVSANGSRLVADPFTSSNQGSGASYVLTPGIAPNPAPEVANAPNGTFVGMYPDGSLYVGNAHPNNGFGGPRPGGPLSTGPLNSGLFETDTGTAVANSNIPSGAMMPTFSPDGTLLTFTDEAIASGGGLATMTFDSTTRTASGYKQIYQVSGSGTYPGWPFFLPDNHGVVFAVGDQADYSGGGTGLGLTGGVATPATSDLYLVDLASDTSTLLAQAVGFASTAAAASGTTYLPFSASDELHHNYDPTVSPVAAGGYFWIFFDSYRHYGNQGLMRQLWGSALDVSPSGHYTTDPSHPPFFLTGQEIGTGNHRAFTALDPCQANGASCTTGEQCCVGFCTNGVCGIPQPRCSNSGETCTGGHKCCSGALTCIAGYCTESSPQ